MATESNFLFKVSFESLGEHKLRTFLTMLGVIIGVAAVVAMLSIGEGAKQEALEQIEILGINNVIVNAKVPEIIGGIEAGIQRSPGLSLDDGKNLMEFTELIANVVPQRYEPISSISYQGNQASVRIVSTTPMYVYSSSIEVEEGRFITQIDMDDFSQVCVLGAKIKKELFAFDNPIGELVRIGDLDFQVVGVMADKYIGRGKVEGFELKNLNEDVYIPLTAAQKKMEREMKSSLSGIGGFVIISGSDEGGQAFNTPEIDQLTVTVTDVKHVSSVSKLIEKVMRRRHAGVIDYEIVVPESLLRQSQKQQQIFNIVMGAIAGLSLLVGGIGIMNIMLASVLERTREIGVRRAVGAKRTDILRQFLIEAVTICMIGCAIGIGLGLMISKAISYYAEWPTVVSVFSIVLAVVVSTSVGLIFGIFPAHKASKLDVIESLRYE